MFDTLGELLQEINAGEDSRPAFFNRETSVKRLIRTVIRTSNRLFQVQEFTFF